MNWLLAFLISTACITTLSAQDVQLPPYKKLAKNSSDGFRKVFSLDEKQYIAVLELNESFFSDLSRLPSSRDSLEYRRVQTVKYVTERESALKKIFTAKQYALFVERKAKFEEKAAVLLKKMENDKKSLKK